MRWKTVGAVAAALVLVPTGAAGAAAPEDEGPEDTNGEYVELTEDRYSDEGYAVEACGSTLTITDGDVRELEEDVDVMEDGSVLVLYRGGYTTDVVRESDGARLEELPDDGPGFELFGADPTDYVVGFEGPALVVAFDEVEARVFTDAGLPTALYYTEGYLEERIEFSPDEAAETIVSAELVRNEVVTGYDVCALLDVADADGRVEGIN